MTNQIVPVLPQSLDLTQSLTSLHDRLLIGSKFVYSLNKSGHKCTNIFNKYNCEDCDGIKELCKAVKLFIKLEREYYLLQIYDIITRYILQVREVKNPTYQMNLF